MIDLLFRLTSPAPGWPRCGLLLSILMVAIVTPVQSQPYPGEVPPNSGMLQPEDQGGEVAALQRRLADLGYYSGPVTGYFDPATQAAVTQFQQSNGLAADGIVGSATSSVLYEADSASPVEGPPASGSSASQPYAGGGDVSSLQQQLTQLGYYTGSATGVFDEQTQTAVMNFQRDRGLAVDGIVGQATQAALYQAPAQSTAAPGTTPAIVTPDGQTAEAPAYTPTATPTDGLLQLGDVGLEVSTLQTQLQALGYYDGPISGSFGAETQSALVAFQQSQGLTADGIAGPQVTTALSSVTPSTTQTAAVTVPQATTPTVMQPTSQPTVQPANAAIAVPPVSTVQPVAQPVIQPGVQPTNPTVQVPAIAPSIPATSPTITQSALPPANPSAPPSSEGGRFSVVELQRRLQLRGFDPAEITGVYDAGTQSAITQAQQAYGLSQGDLFEHY